MCVIRVYQEEIVMNDVAAERGILSGIFRYGADAYVDVSDIVTVNSFSLDSNQVIYKCLETAFHQDAHNVIDLPTFLSAANQLGYTDLFDRSDERKHLRAIMNFSIEKASVRSLAAKVRKLEIARLLHQKLEDSQRSLESVTGSEAISAILGLAENPVFDFTSALSTPGDEEPRPIGEDADLWVQHLIDNPVSMVGVSTSYARWDASIGGGLRRKTINLVGARAKQGKTTIAKNAGLHIAGKLNIPFLDLDTEMNKIDGMARIIANISGIPINEIETGTFAKDEAKQRAVKDAAAYLRSIPYHYKSIAGLPFEEVLAIMRRWILKHVGLDENGKTKDCVISYDYIKLMSGEGLNNAMQEYQALGFIMTGLHNFMVKYDVPCLAFVQLNRDGISVEDTNAVSGSDRLVWLCSNFSIFKKKSDDEIADNPKAGNRKLITIVARHGGGLEDGDYINMHFTGKLGRIVEGKSKRELEVGKVTDFQVTGTGNAQSNF
jgi:replicative DNA helicase